MKIKYSPSPTLAEFHASDARYRIVRGPVGSGKTTAMCMEIMSKAMGQEPNARGVRRTRWIVARNTYGELKDTTMKTWSEVFHPSVFGAPTGLPPSHTLRFKMKDGTKVECQVLFRSLESEQDIKKLLSLDITGAWLNECREFPQKVMTFLGLRIGRFPPKRDVAPTWRGVIGDTNPPDDGHYLAQWEQDPPDTNLRADIPADYEDGEVDADDDASSARFDFFVQPPAILREADGWRMNPHAENLKNLPKGYYRDMMAALSPDAIGIYLANQFGVLFEGKPVWPTYDRFLHDLTSPYVPDPELPMVLGIDFGLTPAVVFLQRDSSGCLVAFDEIICDDLGADELSKMINVKLKRDYPGIDYEVFCDPAGDIRSQVDKSTPIMMLMAHGIDAQPAVTNDWIIRRDAVARALMARGDGRPGLLFGPRCKVLRQAMGGGFCLTKRSGINGEWIEQPKKNRYSHVADALQYAVLESNGLDMLFSTDDLLNAERDTRGIAVGSAVV